VEYPDENKNMLVEYNYDYGDDYGDYYDDGWFSKKPEYNDGDYDEMQNAEGEKSSDNAEAGVEKTQHVEKFINGVIWITSS